VSTPTEASFLPFFSLTSNGIIFFSIVPPATVEFSCVEASRHLVAAHHPVFCRVI
jgi:hypothetical protein